MNIKNNFSFKKPNTIKRKEFQSSLLMMQTSKCHFFLVFENVMHLSTKSRKYFSFNYIQHLIEG